MSIPKGPYKVAKPREEYAILDHNNTVIGSASNLPTAKLFQQSYVMKVFIDEVQEHLPEYRRRQAQQILSDIEDTDEG